MSLPHFCTIIFICITGFLVVGCASSHQGKITPVGSVSRSSEPYKIKGIWYYPQKHYEYDEKGIASWYGPGFHMKKNAVGYAFDQNVVSAAHKTLPLPAVVKVTNLDNGKSLVLVIDDRGPYVEGRIIDLSVESAKRLGVYSKGTAHVRVTCLAEKSRALSKYLGQNYGRGGVDPSGRHWYDIYNQEIKNKFSDDEDSSRDVIVTDTRSNMNEVSLDQLINEQPKRPSPKLSSPVSPTSTIDNVINEVTTNTPKASAPQVKGYVIHLGAYLQRKNAEKVFEELKNVGPVSIQQITVPPGQMFHQVILGPYKSTKEAYKIQQQLQELGYGDADVIQQ